MEGESLWTIAQRYLGDPFRWPLIFEANRETIQNPDSISPGQILVIPGPAAPGAVVQGMTVTTQSQDVQVPEGDVQMIRIVSRPPTGLGRGGDMSGRTIFYGSRGSVPGARSGRPSPIARTAFFQREEAAPAQTVTPSPPSFRGTGLLPVPGGLVFGASWLEVPGAESGALGFLARFAPAKRVGSQEGRRSSRIGSESRLSVMPESESEIFSKAMKWSGRRMAWGRFFAQPDSSR